VRFQIDILARKPDGSTVGDSEMRAVALAVEAMINSHGCLSYFASREDYDTDNHKEAYVRAHLAECES